MAGRQWAAHQTYHRSDTMTAIREFDQADWSTFSGADAWPGHADPLAAEWTYKGEDYYAVCGAIGISIVGDDPYEFMLLMDVPTQAVGRLLLLGLTQTAPHEWPAMGFEVC